VRPNRFAEIELAIVSTRWFPGPAAPVAANGNAYGAGEGGNTIAVNGDTGRECQWRCRALANPTDIASSLLHAAADRAVSAAGGREARVAHAARRAARAGVSGQLASEAAVVDAGVDRGSDFADAQEASRTISVRAAARGHALSAAARAQAHAARAAIAVVHACATGSAVVFFGAMQTAAIARLIAASRRTRRRMQTRERIGTGARGACKATGSSRAGRSSRAADAGASGVLSAATHSADALPTAIRSAVRCASRSRGRAARPRGCCAAARIARARARTTGDPGCDNRDQNNSKRSKRRFHEGCTEHFTCQSNDRLPAMACGTSKNSILGACHR